MYAAMNVCAHVGSFFGRNGAGKSCIVDAIAFCMGASANQLRVKSASLLYNR